MTTRPAPRRWRLVSLDEIGDALDTCARNGTIACGCTWAELIRHYGPGNVIHRDWRGTNRPAFYKRT